jgi:hypothetical protein
MKSARTINSNASAHDKRNSIASIPALDYLLSKILLLRGLLRRGWQCLLDRCECLIEGPILRMPPIPTAAQLNAELVADIYAQEAAAAAKKAAQAFRDANKREAEDARYAAEEAKKWKERIGVAKLALDAANKTALDAALNLAAVRARSTPCA